MGYKNIKFADDIDKYLKDKKEETGFSITTLVNLSVRESMEKDKNKSLINESKNL